MNRKRLREIEREIDRMVENPDNYTVADMAELQKEYSNLKIQEETETKIGTKDIRGIRNAVSMETRITENI